MRLSVRLSVYVGLTIFKVNKLLTLIAGFTPSMFYILLVKIILVQPICTQKLLGNSSLVVAQGCYQVVAQGCDQVAAQGCYQVAAQGCDQVVAQGCYQVVAQGCDQVVAQGCYQVVAQGCDQVVAQGCYQVATTCLQPCNNFRFETVSTL